MVFNKGMCYTNATDHSILFIAKKKRHNVNSITRVCGPMPCEAWEIKSELSSTRLSRWRKSMVEAVER